MKYFTTMVLTTMLIFPAVLALAQDPCATQRREYQEAHSFSPTGANSPALRYSAFCVLPRP